MKSWLVLALSVSAFAVPINLNYSVSGNGAVSLPFEPISSSPFAWIDNHGVVGGSAMSLYGFNPIVGEMAWNNSSWSGSLLLSSAFQLNDAETLSITATTLVASETSPNAAVMFGVLLQEDQAVATLFNVGPYGGVRLSDIGGPPESYFKSVTGGVTATLTKGPPLNAELGGYFYGQPGNFINPASAQITSSYTAGAGTYKLLFGAFSIPNQNIRIPDALAVTSVSRVSVPEPGSLVTMVTEIGSLLLLCVFLRRRQPRHSGQEHHTKL